jgi:translation initiation factor eIF-2B subunit gamma
MPNAGFQAMILCGPGIGLSTFTNKPEDFPKALISVANRPMVWYVLDWCYRMGVSDITLVTPPASKSAIAAALAQNPYLTALPSPTPDLLAPPDLDHTTPTAELLRLPEVQAAIKTDFLLLPCDLVCDVPGETFLETYLTSLGGLGGVGSMSTSGDGPPSILGFGGEKSGRRGGMSVWYNTANREESVKGEECDFMGTVRLDPQYNTPLSKQINPEQPQGTLRKLVSAMPMSELKDECEENKEWRIRQSLLSKYGSLKCLTKFRDSHIYLFPYWVKDFAILNEDFESVSEDLVGTWAKADWRKASYRERFGAKHIFRSKKARRESRPENGPAIEEEIDLLSLSSTQTTFYSKTSSSTPKRAQLASRVPTDPDESILLPNEEDEDEFDEDPPMFPPMLSYIHPSSPTAPLIRRIDMTPLLLAVSLLLAKIPAIEDPESSKNSSPFAHSSKINPSASIAERVTLSKGDTLIDANASIATHCSIKSSVIGSSVTIGQGARLTNCVIMDGSIIGEKCVLNGCVVGKKSSIGKGSNLTNCDVQDGNMVPENTEGKGEKYLVGGLEDEISGDDDADGQDEGDYDAAEYEVGGISIGS